MFTENLDLEPYYIRGILVVAISEEEAIKELQLFEEMYKEWAWDEQIGIEEAIRMGTI